MDETAKSESHLSSAAAFVEGGVQDACDDACSICLEPFSDSDPSTVTGCKHEFHLQCVLEWCQRSSQCPMCWQPLSLKDPTSQELLEVVERERSIMSNQTRNAAIFHHPTLGDFELRHLPVGANDAELEELIIQHLTAAAATGRARLARREGRRGRSGSQRPQFLVFQADPNSLPVGPVSSSSGQRVDENGSAAADSSASPIPLTSVSSSQVSHGTSTLAVQVPTLSSDGNISSTSSPGHSNNRNSGSQSNVVNQDRAGPSDFQSLSESLKSRFSAISLRCKESITKSTRGWKERLFSRSNSVADIGAEVRRDENIGIATESSMMEQLDTRETGRADGVSVSHGLEGHSVSETSNQQNIERETEDSPNHQHASASCAAASGST